MLLNEVIDNIDLIDICKANIDIGDGYSQTAIAMKIQMSEREKILKELQQYNYNGR